MSNSLEIDLVLNRENYSKVYKISYVFLAILIIIVIMFITLKYEAYYGTIARVTDNKLELMVSLDDLSYLNNGIIYLDGKKYSYKISKINKELYISNDYINYVYVYLEIPNLKKIDNYVYQAKLLKSNKLLGEYLRDYFK